MNNQLIKSLKGTVVVSCQARKGEPFDEPIFIAEFAKSATLGGASALRINSSNNIKAVKQVTNLPIIGLSKSPSSESSVFITPTLETVEDVIDAGADIIALDGTFRVRPDHHSLKDLIDYCHEHKKLVLADIATEEDAEFALISGADLLATTLSGYTKETKGQELPNFNLLKSLVSKYSVPIFLEGGISKIEHVKIAFELGAYGIIVGKIITMPHFITRLFVNESQNITKKIGG